MKRAPKVTDSVLPIKKSVAFQWRGHELSFDVAQELFSSHQVDRGSRMLLESLDPGDFPSEGNAADFGCGYGVLGIAWQALRPGWTMHYVDRDALAVAFSRHNVGRLPGAATVNAAFTCDISLPIMEEGLDLVLWNVPGKAGRDVIPGLRDVVIDALVPGGVLAAVVVHPLADLFTDIPGRDDAIVTLSERGKEHTVVHIRRESGDVVARHPFEDGLFDRPAQGYAASDLSWTLTPVIGLPEYDSLNHAAELAARAMIAHRDDHRIDRWMVIEPGVGHLAVVASRLWPDANGHVHGRDALGIRATARALGPDAPVEASPIWGVAALARTGPVDLIVAALPEQASPEELERLLDVCSSIMAPGGAAIFHGRSTEAARLDRVMRRRPDWRARKPEKLRGSASVTARYRASQLDVTARNS